MLPEDAIPNLKCWILSDGKPGHKNQSLGVASGLGLKNVDIIELKKRKFGSFLKYLHPLLAIESDLPKSFPDIIIATGSLTSGISKYLKSKKHNIFNVQMMKPTCGFKGFDVVASPMHDNLPEFNNVITTISAPNLINQSLLEKSRLEWGDKFEKMPSPRITVLVGGSANGFSFGESEALSFINDVIDKYRDCNGSLLFTTSRRTGARQSDIIKNKVESSGINYYFYTPDSKENNPYHGMLAWSDEIVVTAESVSMISESATTGKIVNVWGIDKLKNKKFISFISAMLSKGHVVSFSKNEKSIKPQVSPLNDTEVICGFIRGKLMQRILSK